MSAAELFWWALAIMFLTVLAACFVLVYLVPTIIAKIRKKSNVGGIALVNVLLGWSFIGWIVALVMACSTEPVRVEVTR